MPRACRAAPDTEFWLLDAVVLALGVVGVAIAVAGVLPLSDVAALTERPNFKRAWRALIALILVCSALQLFSLRAKFGLPATRADLAAAGIHLLGPCFVLAVAWLSRSTAHDMIRMASLERAALQDALTGLANRRCFDERLDTEARVAARSGQPLTLVLLDIDHFKAVNDTHGHHAGDLVLQEVAARLTAHMRPADMAARIGGEEFAAILPGLTAAAAARQAERLREVIAASPIHLGDDRWTHITVSLGLAMAAPGESVDALFRRADTALYAAKHGGRDRLSLAAA